MSPEQTGRMNRVVDHRSDFYSLGATLYEMLTGVLPFAAADMMQIVYSHIARRATPPSEVDALITLIDRLPQLVTHLDEDILPVLETLGTVGTDVHDLVDTVQDMRQIVKGFPGSKLFRRRGAEEIAGDEARENAGS